MSSGTSLQLPSPRSGIQDLAESNVVMSCVESFCHFPPPPGCMVAAGSGEEMQKKKAVGGCKGEKNGEGVDRRVEGVILWAFRTAGPSWEISVKRARQLLSCSPLFRDISCGILLFLVVAILMVWLTS